MEQKQVKIIGLELKQDLGILKAHRLVFDANNKLIVFKGNVGAGKTTEQIALQLGTQGVKTLTDKNLYGEIDTETQLIDGETNIWIGCKSNEKSLSYVLYTKDSDGKIINNPVIDGVKATPSKYLEALQTKLTWRMNELTSESHIVQKKILLDLYKDKLRDLEVIFDKKNPSFKNSILGKIETAKKERDYADMQRKQKGGIADDLKAQGIDPDRPATIPDYIDISEIDTEVNRLEKDLAIIDQKSDNLKQKKLFELKEKATEITNKILDYNRELTDEFNAKIAKIESSKKDNLEISNLLEEIKQKISKLNKVSGISNDFHQYIINQLDSNIILKDIDESPTKPNCIEIDENGKITDKDNEKPFISYLNEIRQEFIKVSNSKADNSEQKKEIEQSIAILKTKKETAIATNYYVEAVDSFHEWRECNEKVIKFKSDYVKKLASIETGVDGLKIISEDSGELYLVYDGSFDPKYFNNQDKEFRKLSSYSGTQKPIIALLVQHYLLSKKPKALRYMFIDNIPIDLKTRKLIEGMCEKLDITVIMNITGDFEQSKLSDGEILIENGEVFFN